MNGLIKFNRKKFSWRKTIWNLSKNYGRKKRFRTVSVSIAILMITILFTSLLTLYVGVELSVGRYEIEHYGTKAHGEVFNVPKKAYEELQADKGIKDVAYSRMAGTLSSEIADSKQYYLYYDEPKSMEWEGICITGKYPEEKLDIVLSTRLLQLYGLEEKINQLVKLSYTILGEEHTEIFNITGYYSSPQIVTPEGNYDGNHYPGTYEKVYVSKEFCDNCLSGYREKKIKKYYAANKTNGDGLYQVQLQFSHNYGISRQAQRLEDKYKKYFPVIFLNSGWVRIDPLGQKAENFLAIVLAILIISLVGAFVINSIFQIPIMEDVRFWGLLQTLGVSCQQYRYFLFLQMQTYAIYGILLGGLAGYLIGYVLISLITNNFYNGAVTRYMPFQLWIPCLCSVASFLLSYICCFRVARKVAGLSPVEMEHLREESTGPERRKKLYLGKYKSYRFAWQKLRMGKSRTRPVVVSFMFLLLLLMMVSTFLQSINYSHYMQEQMGNLDFVVLSKNTTKGGPLQDCSSVLDELEESCELTGSRIGKLEKELTLYDKSIPEKQKEIFETVPVEKYLTDNNLVDINLPEHLAYLSVFGFDSGIVRQMEVVEGKIDADKYESGNYVILTADPLSPETGEGEGVENYKNPLYALYGIGDDIEIYGKKYEVMAVVNMPSVLSFYAISNELPVFIPYLEAAGISDEFCTYGEVYQLADLEEDTSTENVINHILTDHNESLEYVSRDTIELQLKALSKMMYTICVLTLFFIMFILMIHAVNVSAFSIQNERHIFAVLQSIGMQRRQQREEICWEYIFQLCISSLVTMIVGSVFSLTVVKKICESTAICVYHYSVMPVIITSILLCAGLSASAIGSYNSIWKRHHMMDLLKEK